MKLGEFKRNVDLYSADLSRWPVTLVRPALELVENDREAAACFEEALALDAALRAADAGLNVCSAGDIYGAGSAPGAGPDIGALEARIMAAIDAPAVDGLAALPPPASRAGRRVALGAVFAVFLLAVFVGLPVPPAYKAQVALQDVSAERADLPADVLADIGGPDDPDFWEEY